MDSKKTKVTKKIPAKSKYIDYLLESTKDLCENANDESVKLKSLKFLNELLKQKFYVLKTFD